MSSPPSAEASTQFVSDSSWISIGLQNGILRSAAPFGGDPADIVIRIHDVACLAVDAVGRVQFEMPRRSLPLHLVDLGGAEMVARIAVLGGTFFHTEMGVRNP